MPADGMAHIKRARAVGKISQSTVRAIRAAHAEGRPLIEIAQEFGVSEGQAGAIARRESYVWVRDHEVPKGWR